MDVLDETVMDVGDEEVFAIEFEVTPEDCLIADRHARSRFMKLALPSWAATLYTSSILFASFLAAMLISGVAGRLNGGDSKLLKISLFLYLAVFLLMLVWRKIVLSRIDRLAADPEGSRCGRVRMIVGKGRLRRITRRGESLTDLTAICDISVLQDHIMIYQDAVAYFCVPRRAFSVAGDEDAFVARLQKGRYSQGPEAPPRTFPDRVVGYACLTQGRCSANESAEDAEDGVPVHVVRRPFLVMLDGMMSNVRNGIRVACFLRNKPELLSTSATAFLAIALFDLILEFLQSFSLVGPGGYFNIYSLGDAVFHLPLFLLSSLIIARVTRRDDLAIALPVVYVAAWIPLGILIFLFNGSLENGWLGQANPFDLEDVSFIIFYWWSAAIVTATFRMSGVKGRRRSVVFAVLLFILILPLWNVPRGDLWERSYDDSEESNRYAISREDAFYAQPVLLENALANLKPGRKGVEDLYFIGFAGYGSQDVFMKETGVIERLFRERFDTSGRSLVMINNPATVLRYPVASATALERALRRVGEIMDRDEDILFLYITSHGSREHRLSVDFWPLDFREIDPAMLKRALDKSGIRWRVVTISACYSGGFIKALQDERTLVITASDATSNSFGCSNESDFTWFSKAFFDEELRRSHSFAYAFQRAELTIRQREVKEDEAPSHPQLSMGNAIRPRLSLLEKRLDRLEQKLQVDRK